MPYTLPTTDAQFLVKLTCDCPHCHALLDLYEILDPDDLPAACTTADTEILVNCPECEETFTVTRVIF